MIRTIIVEDDLMVAAIDKNMPSARKISVLLPFHNGNDVYSGENTIDLIILDLPGLSKRKSDRTAFIPMLL